MINRHRLRSMELELPVSIGIAGATTILLVALSSRLLAAPIDVAQPAPTSVTVHRASLPARSACWVSGDLAGDANPVRVYATLCGVSGSARPAETHP
jgi:hypothetical protein